MPHHIHSQLLVGCWYFDFRFLLPNEFLHLPKKFNASNILRVIFEQFLYEQTEEKTFKSCIEYCCFCFIFFLLFTTLYRCHSNSFRILLQLFLAFNLHRNTNFFTKKIRFPPFNYLIFVLRCTFRFCFFMYLLLTCRHSKTTLGCLI